MQTTSAGALTSPAPAHASVGPPATQLALTLAVTGQAGPRPTSADWNARLAWGGFSSWLGVFLWGPGVHQVSAGGALDRAGLSETFK